MIQKKVFNIFIVIGILLILISPLFLLPKFLGGKHFCNEINGNYSYSFNGTQYCNQKIIKKYFIPLEQKSFWDFEDNTLINRKIE